ncbi:MAG: EAL domain-containing protein, partial [Oscillospiraceae bacterium]
EIELTESTMLDNEAILIDVLCKLHQHGFMLSMDDFGSGYSSLGMLKSLPVDTLKLDRTFFTQYTDFERAKIVIESVILMAKKLGICTVAEGVENKAHIDLLSEVGCDIVQGYYYAKPMSLLDLNELLREEDRQEQARQ